MDLQELLRKRLIEKVKPDDALAKELLQTAEKDIVVAEDNLKMKHSDWAFAIAYNSMLNAGRALLASKGYRTCGETHHFAVVKFCATLIPPESSVLVHIFNKSRVRRHDIVYGEAESVGEDEAERIIGKAKLFLEKVKELLRTK